MSGRRRCEGFGKFRKGIFEDWGGDDGSGGYQSLWLASCCAPKQPDGGANP